MKKKRKKEREKENEKKLIDLCFLFCFVVVGSQKDTEVHVIVFIPYKFSVLISIGDRRESVGASTVSEVLHPRRRGSRFSLSWQEGATAPPPPPPLLA